MNGYHTQAALVIAPEGIKPGFDGSLTQKIEQSEQ